MVGATDVAENVAARGDITPDAVLDIFKTAIRAETKDVRVSTSGQVALHADVVMLVDLTTLHLWSKNGRSSLELYVVEIDLHHRVFRRETRGSCLYLRRADHQS